MSNLIAQVRLPGVSSLPEDIVINTWSVTSATSSVLQCEDIADALGEEFYAPLSPYLSETVDGGGVEVKVYDRADSVPRSPIVTRPEPISISGAETSYPREVAVCLSFAAATPSGSNAARRRGRIYLGPFNDTVHVTSGAYVRPSPTFIEDMLDAWVALETAWGAISAGHQVYSPSDSVGRDVVRAWIDNEWDTVRSRGTRATARGTRP